MNIDLLFLLIFSVEVIVFFFTGILTIKKREIRILFLIFITGLYFYSGFGLVFYDIPNKYLINFGLIVFSFIFLLFSIYYSNRKTNKFLLSNLVKYLDHRFIWFMMLIHMFTFIFPLIYPEINIFSIFDFTSLVHNYRVLPFETRVFRSNDFLYVLFTVQLRLVTLPFFFMWLYTKKGKPFIFVFMFLLPFYLQTITNLYISRNELSVIFAFLIIYFYTERVFNRKLVIISLLFLLPIIITFFSQLYFTRISLGNNLNLLDSIIMMFRQETAFVTNYPTIVQYNSDVNIIQFLLYLITLPIPFDVLGLLGLQTPNLAQILTYRVTGLSYGDSNYFLLLPSVYGEGIMIFNL